jgi:tetratricopeptide (TPR) repeat protein
MKPFVVFVITIFTLTACNQKKKIIVDAAFTDSLLSKFTISDLVKTNQKELDFWGGRINPKVHDLVSEPKYAGLLSARFGLLGDINDIRSSDSILNNLAAYFNYTDATPMLPLIHNAISQHRFRQADTLLNKAKAIGLRKYASSASSFDVNFELGRYMLAENDLKSIGVKDDYGYQFRKSKLWHYKGDVDSAITAMKSAVDLSENSIAFKQSALSNTADLYLHNAALKNAYDLYVQSIRLASSDMHSIMGIGWIALVHDKNDSLAEKIFKFVHAHTKIADPLYKLEQVAEQRGDSVMQKKYADEFVQQVSETVYGNMYNKYTIELYTGILNNPAKAESIAENEILSRATPQTYAWYVWTLFKNNKSTEAYNVYEKYVSGKPLEGLELYYMGKFMKSLNKGYNAQQFFKKAEKNKYDLTPGMIKDLEDIASEE